ncbi:MAG: hypothetical protein WAM60_26840, partial [Candidatus Promineifilaceae bacterium]
MVEKPKLRLLDFQPIIYQDQEMFLLRDPLELSDYQIILPPGLLQMLAFVDGERTVLEIQEAFSQYIGFPIDGGLVERTLTQLDSAYLLDNAHSQQAIQALLDDYR